MTSTTFFILFIPILSIILLLVNLLLAPHNPYQEKDRPFECGFSSFIDQNRTQFSVSFFIFGLLFLLFDLEILLVYPYSVSGYNNDIYGLIIMMIFFVLLTLGFIFELGKNALTIESKQTLSLNDLEIPISHFFSKLFTTISFGYRGHALQSGLKLNKFLILIFSLSCIFYLGWLSFCHNYPIMNDFTIIKFVYIIITVGCILTLITSYINSLEIDYANFFDSTFITIRRFILFVFRNLPLQFQVLLIINLVYLVINLVCLLLGFLPPASDVVAALSSLYGDYFTSMEPCAIGGDSGENLQGNGVISDHVAMSSNPSSSTSNTGNSSNAQPAPINWNHAIADELGQRVEVIRSERIRDGSTSTTFTLSDIRYRVAEGFLGLNVVYDADTGVRHIILSDLYNFKKDLFHPNGFGDTNVTGIIEHLRRQ